MTSLQTATDIVGLIFMGVIILYVLIMLVVTIVVLRKVSKLQAAVQDKLETLRSMPYIGKKIFSSVKR